MKMQAIVLIFTYIPSMFCVQHLHASKTSPKPLLLPLAPSPHPRPPSDWTIPGEADSGFADSELRHKRPGSVYPPTLASSFQSVVTGASGTGEGVGVMTGRSGSQREQHQGMPSLTA